MPIRKNVIQDKSYKFALEIIKVVKDLPKNTACFEIGKQLIRSGTSIGANVEEALGGSSKKDFIYKLTISKKEARETLYWLRLIFDSQLSNNPEIKKLIYEANELVRILTSIVKTSENQNKQKE